MNVQEQKRFSKGDPVPAWVQKTDNVDLYFGTDVEVHRQANGEVSVYPVERGNGDFVLMRGHARVKHKETKITGAPTHLFAYPYGSPHNPPP